MCYPKGTHKKNTFVGGALPFMAGFDGVDAMILAEDSTGAVGGKEKCISNSSIRIYKARARLQACLLWLLEAKWAQASGKHQRDL